VRSSKGESSAGIWLDGYWGNWGFFAPFCPSINQSYMGKAAYSTFCSPDTKKQPNVLQQRLKQSPRREYSKAKKQRYIPIPISYCHPLKYAFHVIITKLKTKPVCSDLFVCLPPASNRLPCSQIAGG
jgi:hypothetical protein